MAGNTRFAVAVHIMGVLAALPDEAVTSDRIAASVNTNPVVVRRLICSLGRAGLVRSQPGAAGGTRLARDPARITLLDIYRAAGAGEMFALPARPPDPRCPVGCNVQEVLGALLAKAERSTGRLFATVSLRRFTASILRRSRVAPASRRRRTAARRAG